MPWQRYQQQYLYCERDQLNIQKKGNWNRAVNLVPSSVLDVDIPVLCSSGWNRGTCTILVSRLVKLILTRHTHVIRIGIRLITSSQTEKWQRLISEVKREGVPMKSGKEIGEKDHIRRRWVNGETGDKKI